MYEQNTHNLPFRHGALMAASPYSFLDLGAFLGGLGLERPQAES